MLEGTIPSDPTEEGKQISDEAKADVEGAVAGAVGHLATYGAAAVPFGPAAVVAVGVVGAVQSACTGTAGKVIKDKIWKWLGW